MSRLSPDGLHVVYIADADVDGVDEVFSVPVTGGASTKLNDPLVAGGTVELFRISPNSDRVVYRADQDTNELFELSSLPPTSDSDAPPAPLALKGAVRLLVLHAIGIKNTSDDP